MKYKDFIGHALENYGLEAYRLAYPQWCGNASNRDYV